MESGLESPESSPIRVLVVSAGNWTSRVSSLLDVDVSVRGSLPAVDDGDLASADCVLTADRTVLDAVDSTPVVFLADADDTIEGVLDAGATDVVLPETIAEPSLLEHRLRQTSRLHSTAEALERRERRFRTIIDHSADLLAVIAESGRVRYVSPSIERMFGVDPAEIRGEYAIDAVHPDDRGDVLEAFAAVREDGPGGSRTIEYRHRQSDDTWGVYEATLTNKVDDPVVEGVIASVRDVTEFHRVERELGESFERVTDAFFALDADFRFTYVNDRAADLLEYDPDSLLGRGFLDVFPEMHDTEFERRALGAIEDQKPRTIERYYEPYDMWIEARLYPSNTGISVYFRDVSDRVERERELAERTERLQVLVENAPIVLYVLDEDGTFTLSEGRGLKNIGIEPGEVVGNSIFDVFDSYPGIRDDARRALDGDTVHSERSVRDRVFETWYKPIEPDGELERIVGVAVDVTERVQYREALNALHEATSHLLSVESKQAACEYIVDVATDVLDVDSVLYRFDEERNELVPAAYSAAFESAFGSPPRLGPGEGPAWRAFVDGTPTADEDVDEGCWGDDGTVGSGLYVPLGEHGVLVALSTETAAYDEDAVELTKLFATTAEAALDRIGRTRRLHDRERELERQNVHLEQLNHANRIRQDIEQLLLVADSRAEIEAGICKRLAALESCTMVWIGEPDPGGSEIRPRSIAGIDREYHDAVTVTAVDDSAAEPAGRTARASRPTYVENVADAIRDGDWRGEALSRNYQSVYAVPLRYDDFLYGVLAVYGDGRNAFDETVRSTLAELGETIGYAIDAVTRRTAIEDDERTEVELELDVETTLSRLAAAIDRRLSFEGAASREDGSTVVFVATDASIDDSTLEGAVETIEGIDEASVISATEDESLLQLTRSDPFVGSIVEAHGARLREITTDGTTTTAIVDVPDSIEIRELLAELERDGFPTTMVARRDQPSTDEETLDARNRSALLETLTERQREVVQTAYHGGFFEWPRETTGEEIADSLEISPPAFHKHVRSVEGKLFEALFHGAPAIEGG